MTIWSLQHVLVCGNSIFNQIAIAVSVAQTPRMSWSHKSGSRKYEYNSSRGKTKGKARNIASFSKEQINQRDIYGRTLLHVAASVGDVNTVQAILDNNQADTTLQDYESGWNALHRALYAGNIRIAQMLIAHNKDLIKCRDRNKDTPLHILHSALSSHNSKVTQQPLRLFALGSNANHTLGLPDPDTRVHASAVKFNDLSTDQGSTVDPLQMRSQYSIEKVCMSKLHSAVITNLEHDNLMICGFSRGGRLGLGSLSQKSSRVSNFKTLKSEEFVDPEESDTFRVVDVALGLHHTVAVGNDGNCYTFGSNEQGQLGIKSLDVCDTPSFVTNGEIRRANLIGCAASNVHSIVYSETEIFGWGLNQGQMFSVVDNQNEIQWQPRRILLGLQDAEISMVVASEKASVILARGSKYVYVMCGSSMTKIDMIRPSYLSQPKTHDDSSFSSYMIPMRQSHITKIAMSPGGSFLLALTSDGSIYSLQLPAFNQPLRAKDARVKHVWLPRTKFLAAVDIDVADDGSVILCVAGGHVFQINTSGKQKIDRVANVSRAVSVACDPNFASFLMVSAATVTPPVVVSKNSLVEDLEYLVPFCQLNKTDFSESAGAVDQDGMFLDRWLAFNPSPVDNFEFPSRSYDANFVVGESKIPVHRSIILARCPSLASPVIELQGGLRIVTRESSLHFEGFEPVAVLVLIYYLYTDRSLKPWSSKIVRQPSEKLISSKRQVILLKQELKLKNVWVESYENTSPRPSLDGSLGQLAADRDDHGADVAVHLSDGTYYCHSYILAVRCVFFHMLLSERWYAYRTYEDKYTHIKLDHIPKGVFGVVCAFLYGDFTADELFKDAAREFSRGEESQFLEFVLTVMEIADELLIPKLQELCEVVVSRFLSVKNIGSLISEGLTYPSCQLLPRAQYFAVANLECLLENGFLGVDRSDVTQSLEAYLKGIVPSQTLPETAPLRFMADLEEHNESTSRLVPVPGALMPRSTGPLLKTGVAKVLQDDHEEGVFVLDDDNIRDNLTKLSVSGPSHSVSQQTPRRGSTAEPTWFSPPVKAVEQPEWNTVGGTGRRAGSNSASISTSNAERARADSVTISSPPAVPVPSFPRISKSKVSDAVTPPKPASTSVFTPTVIEVNQKLSQKERKRLQREKEAALAENSSNASPTLSANQTPTKSNAWGSVASSSSNTSPWAKPVASPVFDIVSETLNQAKDNKKRKDKHVKIASSLFSNGTTTSATALHSSWTAAQPSLGDIIDQQQRYIEVKAQQANRSLEDIQQEEEFEKWWAEESRKVQESNGENAPSSSNLNSSSQKKRSRNRNRGTRRRNESIAS